MFEIVTLGYLITYALKTIRRVSCHLSSLMAKLIPLFKCHGVFKKKFHRSFPFVFLLPFFFLKYATVIFLWYGRFLICVNFQHLMMTMKCVYIVDLIYEDWVKMRLNFIGTSVFRNVDGYLSADLAPLLPLYAGLAFSYGGLGAFWAILLGCYFKVLLCVFKVGSRT